jgi:predicted NBD/HSP70 family sugar kinase
VNREQLAHVLRAVSSILADRKILVIGSQSILATYDEEELPVEATASVEVDRAFFDDDDEASADQVDGAIGELS